MRITATASSWTWMMSQLRQRDVTVAGLTYTTMKLSLEQAAGQVTGRVGHDVTSVLDLGQLDRLHLVGAVLGGLAVVLGFGDGWASGPVGIVVTAILPVGGPVWAGLVPVESIFSGVRKGSGLACRLVRGFGAIHPQPALAGIGSAALGAMERHPLLPGMRIDVRSGTLVTWACASSSSTTAARSWTPRAAPPCSRRIPGRRYRLDRRRCCGAGGGGPPTGRAGRHPPPGRERLRGRSTARRQQPDVGCGGGPDVDALASRVRRPDRREPCRGVRGEDSIVRKGDP